MKVGLLGFGKTGKAVASVLLLNKDVELQWVIRKSRLLEHRSVPEFLGIESDEPGLIYSMDEFPIEKIFHDQPIDVLIDFSSEDGIDYYYEALPGSGVSLVTAVSNYSADKVAKLERLGSVCKVVWAPNITIGINFLILASQVLKEIAPYTDIQIIEEHFRDKAEISGTAKRAAAVLELAETDIKSIRVGGIIGVHEIIFGFPYQTVRLRHESISREAFGNGAIFAATELQKTASPGLYQMEQLMEPYFKGDNQSGIIKTKRSWLEGLATLFRSRKS
jgi:4-hydroxy-tetrahydrodipicolinate reductase